MEDPKHNNTSPAIPSPRDSSHCRMTVRLSWNTVTRLKQVYPANGIYQLMAETLFTKFINSLEQNGYTDFDPSGFKHALKECVIGVPSNPNTTRPDNGNTESRGADAQLPPGPKSSSRDVGGRTRKVARKG